MTQHSSITPGLQASGLSVAVNLVLAVVKIVTGLLGSSYALVADGIESTADILSSLVVWGGLRVASIPADEGHPYGHGKAESIAGLIVAVALLAAAGLIAVESIQEIRQPHHAPEWYTLVVLLAVIIVKESLHRFVFRVADQLDSIALKGDAWHHRSDALTSAAAFLGISVALIGGEGFEPADDAAALVACLIIAYNGFRVLRGAVGEVMDAAVPDKVTDEVRAIATGVHGVSAIEKCRIRKSGLGLFIDIHVEVNGNLTVRDGHEIAHRVKDELIHSRLQINDVTVHIEPGS